MSTAWLSFQSPTKRPNYATGGWDDPRDGGTRRHRAMDFRAAIGDPIYAVGDGVVTASVDLSATNSAGQMIEIEHAGGMRSRYMHLGQRLVKRGQRVARGQMIGTGGRSGIKISAPHLHFDLQVPSSGIGPYEALFGRPIGGYRKHPSTGRYMVPVEQVIPIDSGRARIYSDATKFGLTLRSERPGTMVATLPAAIGLRPEPGKAAVLLGVSALAVGGAFAWATFRP